MEKEQTSLREQFIQTEKENQERRAEQAPKIADKSLNNLADNFVSLVQGRVERGETDVFMGPRYVPFKIEGTELFSEDKVKELPGYAKLHEVCRDSGVDMKVVLSPTDGMFTDHGWNILVFYTEPYKVEECAVKITERKGFLDRIRHR